MKKQLQCVQIGTFTLFQAQVIEMFCVIFSNLKLAAILILLFFRKPNDYAGSFNTLYCNEYGLLSHFFQHFKFLLLYIHQHT